ncbi:hypothetical protein V5799_030912 [Amblyomma americanum]|uniref:RNA-directed DNA polymerase n=1 Tax=Amblyomma americanum TaxID=6943 RepID=A0AAQ4ELQ6_AMBAM
MEELLHGIDGVIVLLDDILIGGKDEAQHHACLQEVLKRIHEDGLRLKFDKCQFCVEEMCYLVFRVNSAGVQPTEDKVRAIHEAPKPTCKKELQAFLGALNFYKFLKGAAHVLEPLYRLLDKGREWRWTEAERDAFRQAKGLLQSSHVLVNYDVNKPLVLACDASPYGLGAVLSHKLLLNSDNGTAFCSEEFRDFMCRNQIRHVTVAHITLLRMVAERMVRETKEVLKRMVGGNIDTRLARFLMTQHILPRATTGKSPAELLMGRKLSTVLERLHPDLQSDVQQKQEQVMQRRNQQCDCLKWEIECLCATISMGPSGCQALWMLSLDQCRTFFIALFIASGHKGG